MLCSVINDLQSERVSYAYFLNEMTHLQPKEHF